MARLALAPAIPDTLPAVDAELRTRALELSIAVFDEDLLRLAVLRGRVDRLLDRRLELGDR